MTNIDPTRGFLGGGPRRPPRPMTSRPPPPPRPVAPAAPPAPVLALVVTKPAPAPVAAQTTPPRVAVVTKPKAPPKPRVYTSPSDLVPTVRQKILFAACDLDPEGFSVDALTVACWKRWPETFGLTVHPHHPDNNKVIAKLSGIDGVCGLAWLRYVAPRTYQVTYAGRALAVTLRKRLGDAEMRGRLGMAGAR